MFVLGLRPSQRESVEGEGAWGVGMGGGGGSFISFHGFYVPVNRTGSPQDEPLVGFYPDVTPCGYLGSKL